MTRPAAIERTASDHDQRAGDQDHKLGRAPVLCAWCGRHLGTMLVSSSSAEQVSHGICGACAATLRP